ncbi:hypothetical protein Tco_1309355, partial [Tanacetum coccineum]
IKKPWKEIGYSGKFDGASYVGFGYSLCLVDNTIGIQDSYMIWLCYTNNTERWEEAKNFVTFCFRENEDYEVKEFGARLVCDGDLEQDTNMSTLQDLPTES